MKYKNIIYDVWIWIMNDLGFSRYVVPLYVVVVIFRKESTNKKWDIRKVKVLSIDIQNSILY